MNFLKKFIYIERVYCGNVEIEIVKTNIRIFDMPICII